MPILDPYAMGDVKYVSANHRWVYAVAAKTGFVWRCAVPCAAGDGSGWERDTGISVTGIEEVDVGGVEVGSLNPKP